MLNDNSYYDIDISKIIFFAEPPAKRLNGEMRSDVSIAIPLQNKCFERMSFKSDELTVVFKNSTGKIFSMENVFSFADYESTQTIVKNQKKMLKFKIIISKKTYHELNQLRQLWITFNKYPPFCLSCNESQGNWALTTLAPPTGSSDSSATVSSVKHQATYPPSNTTQNFSFSCPFCGQHFDCPPECEGVACECPTCNNTIYPTRPTEIKKVNSKLVISCALFDIYNQNSNTSLTATDEIKTDNVECSAEQTKNESDSDSNSTGYYFDEDEIDNDVDWDEIDDAAESDMDDVLDALVDETKYDMPEEASDDFERDAEDAWMSYSMSSSFPRDLKDWCDENGYDIYDDKEYAEDAMKDEWIDEWKMENEDDWNERWCEDHAEELKEKWRRDEERNWRIEWANDNASYHDVSVREILKHWGFSSKKTSQETTTKIHHSNTQTVKDKTINDGEKSMKNKIPVETKFRTLIGNVTAALRDGKIILYADLTCPDYKKHKYSLDVAVIAYDADGDICARENISLCYLEDPRELDFVTDSMPVRLVAREEER